MNCETAMKLQSYELVNDKMREENLRKIPCAPNHMGLPHVHDVVMPINPSITPYTNRIGRIRSIQEIFTYDYDNCCMQYNKNDSYKKAVYACKLNYKIELEKDDLYPIGEASSHIIIDTITTFDGIKFYASHLSNIMPYVLYRVRLGLSTLESIYDDFVVGLNNMLANEEFKAGLEEKFSYFIYGDKDHCYHILESLFDEDAVLFHNLTCDMAILSGYVALFESLTFKSDIYPVVRLITFNAGTNFLNLMDVVSVPSDVFRIVGSAAANSFAYFGNTIGEPMPFFFTSCFNNEVNVFKFRYFYTLHFPCKGTFDRISVVDESSSNVCSGIPIWIPTLTSSLFITIISESVFLDKWITVHDTRCIDDRYLINPNKHIRVHSHKEVMMPIRIGSYCCKDIKGKGNDGVKYRLPAGCRRCNALYKTEIFYLESSNITNQVGAYYTNLLRQWRSSIVNTATINSIHYFNVNSLGIVNLLLRLGRLNELNTLLRLMLLISVLAHSLTFPAEFYTDALKSSLFWKVHKDRTRTLEVDTSLAYGMSLKYAYKLLNDPKHMSWLMFNLCTDSTLISKKLADTLVYREEDNYIDTGNTGDLDEIAKMNYNVRMQLLEYDKLADYSYFEFQGLIIDIINDRPVMYRNMNEEYHIVRNMGVQHEYLKKHVILDVSHSNIDEMHSSHMAIKNILIRINNRRKILRDSSSCDDDDVHNHVSDIIGSITESTGLDVNPELPFNGVPITSMPLYLLLNDTDLNRMSDHISVLDASSMVKRKCIENPDKSFKYIIDTSGDVKSVLPSVRKRDSFWISDDDWHAGLHLYAMSTIDPSTLKEIEFETKSYIELS